MAEYIEREAFLTQKREQYCKDCARRKGMRNGKYKTIYEIGEAPCRACEIDDVLNDVEDFPAADVVPMSWVREHTSGDYISREQAVENAIDQMHHSASETAMRERLLNLVAADVRPVVRARWEDDWETGCSTCSACGEGFLWEDNSGVAEWNFCPACGADMRRES